MTGTGLRAVESFAVIKGQISRRQRGESLESEIEASAAAAVEHARRRLTARLPVSAMTDTHQYFAAPALHLWPGRRRPEVTVDDLLDDICSRPRSVTAGEKAAGLQVELRSLSGHPGLADVGEPVEPGTGVVQLLAARLAAVAAQNASIELRQFDRQCLSWAPFADDIAAVTGADVFLKLFVAGGDRSVNGWHRDGSDVLITVIHGAKRFCVADAEDSTAEPVSVVDAVLRPGDALLLPRARAHCATPVGELCALLSVGVMRIGDWPFRQVLPGHLGFHDYARSATVYRLCLRSHVPVGTSRRMNPGTDLLRSRLPGGLALLDRAGAEVSFVGAGWVYAAQEALVRVLADIHAADGITADDVAAVAGLSRRRCRSIVADLLFHGLIRT